MMPAINSKSEFGPCFTAFRRMRAKYKKKLLGLVPLRASRFFATAPLFAEEKNAGWLFLRRLARPNPLLGPFSLPLISRPLRTSNSLPWGQERRRSSWTSSQTGTLSVVRPFESFAARFVPSRNFRRFFKNLRPGIGSYFSPDDTIGPLAPTSGARPGRKSLDFFQAKIPGSDFRESSFTGPRRSPVGTAAAQGPRANSSLATRIWDRLFSETMPEILPRPDVLIINARERSRWVRRRSVAAAIGSQAVQFQSRPLEALSLQTAWRQRELPAKKSALGQPT